jgi:hypothetical protein
MSHVKFSVPRKCRVGDVWKYGSGLAYIVAVTNLDVAPQCEALIAARDGRVTSRWRDGQIRSIGIMEQELIERVGTWVPHATYPRSGQARA